MDPQQRLVLERGYAALHGAALTRESLLGSLTGVCVGICSHDFAELLKESAAGRSVYAVTGASASIASGRVSFALGLHGPCVSYDTACSAALVACHGAQHSLRVHECDSALVAGVNLLLIPSPSDAMALAGMTSVGGRCHTYAMPLSRATSPLPAASHLTEERRVALAGSTCVRTGSRVVRHAWLEP